MRSLITGAAMIAVAAAMGFFFNPAQVTSKPAPIPEAAPGKSELAPRPVKENVIAYHTGDADMNGAKKKAYATLPRFHELIKAGTRGTYTVKFPLTQNGETEHIWMQLIDFRDGAYVGLLANDPVNGSDYRMGDEMTVAAADVEDWMVNTGTEMYGGYTVRVMLGEMPKEEADKLRPMFRD